MNIEALLKNIKKEIPSYVTLVAVSKTRSVEMIAQVYEAGQRVFGENKARELTYKHLRLPSDIKWHMIGHLQTNKVKYIAPFVELIHSVDRLKLWKEIEKQGKKIGRKINCLLQVKIAREESKFGLDKKELLYILKEYDAQNESFVNICGLMGMASFTNDKNQIDKEFEYLQSLYRELRDNHPYLTTLSMGMSGDYSIAIKRGSNMIRIGSKIFEG